LIPDAYINQWKSRSPWQQNEFVEQDLILTRLLVELYSDELISANLAFRGGTALNKLFLKNPYRYSEDLDFVQIKAGDIGAVLTVLRRIIRNVIPSKPKYNKSKIANTLIYYYTAENPPNSKMRIKIEINTREHLAFDGIRTIKQECISDWFTGLADIVTYSAEELLATKLRALYQRSKGRDLFDLWVSRELNHNPQRTIEIFKLYLENENLSIAKKDFTDNLNDKFADAVFRNDIIPLIRQSSEYDIKKAFEYVHDTYLLHL